MSVIIHDKIKTTATRAKAVQPFVENLITIAKRREKREAIREIHKLLEHKDAGKKILEVLVDKYKDQKSGYTRITKLGNRKGDNAPVVQLELV